jgi:hypothetical protein
MPRMIDRNKHLNSTVEVARHQIGRANEMQHATLSMSVTKAVDAAVL